MTASTEGKREKGTVRESERATTMAPRNDGSIDLLLHSYAPSNRDHHESRPCMTCVLSVMQSQYTQYGLLGTPL